MRRVFWMSVVVAAGLLVSGSQMQAVQGTVTAATGNKVTIQTRAGDSYNMGQPAAADPIPQPSVVPQ